MRKENVITINDRGTDKKFKIVEMPATQLQDWIIRAGLLLTSALEGADVNGTPNINALVNLGSQLLSKGLTGLSKISYEKARPLLDEMLQCCYRMTESGITQQCTRNTVDGFIDDVQTLAKLEMEAFSLNLSFFVQEKESTSPPSEATLKIPASKQS